MPEIQEFPPVPVSGKKIGGKSAAALAKRGAGKIQMLPFLRAPAEKINSADINRDMGREIAETVKRKREPGLRFRIEDQRVKSLSLIKRTDPRALFRQRSVIPADESFQLHRQTCSALLPQRRIQKFAAIAAQREIPAEKEKNLPEAQAFRMTQRLGQIVCQNRTGEDAICQIPVPEACGNPFHTVDNEPDPALTFRKQISYQEPTKRTISFFLRGAS